MKQYRRRMEARSRHLTGAGGVGGAEGAGEVGELEPSPHWKTEGIDGRSSMSEIASCSLYDTVAAYTLDIQVGTS